MKVKIRWRRKGGELFVRAVFNGKVYGQTFSLGEISKVEIGQCCKYFSDMLLRTIPI